METRGVGKVPLNGPSRIKPGEHPLQFLKRIREEQAARDPAFAALEELRKRRAETSYAVDHDLGGD